MPGRNIAIFYVIGFSNPPIFIIEGLIESADPFLTVFLNGYVVEPVEWFFLSKINNNG